MKSKSIFNFLGTLSDFQFNMLFTNEDEEIYKTGSISNSKRSNRNLDDFQIFTDHLKLNERFKKTLYYGKLPATECPSLPLSDAALELFTKTVPNGGLDVLDMHYAASVSRKACISPCSLILAIMYLDQLRHKNPEYLQNVASCDLFLISMLVASKFLYDNGEDDEVFNTEWACSANIDVKDLNNLEREFLAALNWEVFVKPSEFFNLVREVECKIALKEMSKRGWFTYTDISVLSHNSVSVEIITILVDNVIKVIVITAVAYVVAVMTLLGASRLCQKSIPVVQDVVHGITRDNASASSLTTSNTTLSVEKITSVTISNENMPLENLSTDWLRRALSSDGHNETVSLGTFPLPGLNTFNSKTKLATEFLHAEYKDHHAVKLEPSPFTNDSVGRQFMVSSMITGQNCFVVYIEPCFQSTVPLNPRCVCSSELDLWLSSVYHMGNPFSICQKYFSKTLQE